MSSGHQYEATPRVRPPSSERKRSTPAAQTRSESSGSTAITLQCQPIGTNDVDAFDVQRFCTAAMKFVRRYGLVGSALFVPRTSAVHEPGSPALSERKTARRF